MAVNVALLPGETRWRRLEVLTGDDGNPPPPSGITVDDVVSSMWGLTPETTRTDTTARNKWPGLSLAKSDAFPAGIPSSFDWYHGARPWLLTPPPWSGWSSVNHDASEVWTHHNAWGEVIPVAGSVHQTRDVRFQLGPLTVCHLNGARTAWTTVRSSEADNGTPSSQWYSASPQYRATTVDFGPWRRETVGWSAPLTPALNADGTPNTAQCIGHWFYPQGFMPRLLVPSGGSLAFMVKVRLISDNPNVTADILDQPNWIMRLTGDVFTASDVSVHPSKVNPALASPRFRLLSSQWMTYVYAFGTEADIRSYPTIPFVTA